MKRFIFALLPLTFAVVANAEIYRWQDENNKTIISDRPPPSNVRKLKRVESEAPPADADKVMADREMEFRKRQKDAKESAEKADKDKRQAAEKQDNCDRARRALKVFESGERVVTQDSKGERVFLDDAQREREIARNREFIQQSCN